MPPIVCTRYDAAGSLIPVTAMNGSTDAAPLPIVPPDAVATWWRWGRGPPGPRGGEGSG